MSDSLSRRNLLKAAGAASVVGAGTGGALVIGCREAGVPICSSSANAAPAVAPVAVSPGNLVDEAVARDVLFFFNEPEARFVAAAVERLIPSDPVWPGAAWAGVLNFIDRQLASAYGAGERMYLNGPWFPQAPPQQGYQLRYAPAQLYRIAIEEIRQHVLSTQNNREFWDLTAETMDNILSGLESGAIALPSVPSPVFFETLLANTIEGYFADPAYGGNREMVGWQMVGFPGAYAQYVDLIELYDYDYKRPPISMGNQVARKAHLHEH